MTFKFNPITNRLDITGTSGGGGGDVSGPGSSTDNAIVRWSGTTGTLIQNSVATLSDTGDIIANSIDLTVPVDETNGGTGQSSYTTGDILYASGANTLSVLPIGSSTQVLTVTGGVPVWAAAGGGGGGVTSVTGTANRISSTGGTTPVIDIDAAYVGQTSITTLGTITSGTWNGSTIDVSHGGTGRTTLTNHGVLIGAGTSAITQLAAGTAGQVLQSGGAGADPAYSTATYPSTATGTGTILRADGTNWVASTATYPNTATTGDLIYGSASNTYSNLAVSTTAGYPVASSGTLPIYLDPKKYIYLWTDFIPSSVSSSSYPFITGTSSGSDSNATGTATHPGIAQVSTSSSATGKAIYKTANTARGQNPFVLGGGTFDLRILCILSTLSDGTETYSAVFGLTDIGATSDSITNGVYFSYSSTGATPNWQINCVKSGSGTTTQDSGVAASATNWQLLQIVINAAATSVSFYIDGVEVTNSPLSTNIPTAAVGPCFYILKSAGTTARTLQVDYFYLFHNMTTARS